MVKENETRMDFMGKKRICVYGAASDDIPEEIKKDCYELGKILARKNHHLIFGAGSEGVMGAVAEGAYDFGGKIYGIAPTWMNKFEGIYSNCDSFIYTKSMDERKYLFKSFSDAFIIAPGGLGTMDELFDVTTLKKLDRFNKPIIVFNSAGFYEELLSFLQKMEKMGIVPPNDDLYEIANSVDEIFEILEKKLE